MDYMYSEPNPDSGALQKIHAIRALMIAVATGSRRIEEAEAEYAKIRNEVVLSLRSLGINNPNPFHSLWDWYSYWKENGLATYQSRRAYVTSLFSPVIEALETPPALRATDPKPQAEAAFSVRLGYVRSNLEAPISIREELPQAVRRTIIQITTHCGWNSDDLLTIASRIGKKSWEPPEPLKSGSSSLIQLGILVSRWEWFLVYDFIERLYESMESWIADGEARPEDHFAEVLNDYFRDVGVGWQLQHGRIQSRGSEAFEIVVRNAIPDLEQTDQRTAAQEIHEALADLSRRPQADLTGAIHHAMGALECVARTVTGDSQSTLGTLISRYPDLIPRPLDISISKAWGYASERARHIREGNGPARDEAELIVGIAATLASYLSKKKTS